MNHQMIVVKLQPLWMLLLRGSTRVYSDAHDVWVGDFWYGLYGLKEVSLLWLLHMKSKGAQSAGELHSSSSCISGQHKV